MIRALLLSLLMIAPVLANAKTEAGIVVPYGNHMLDQTTSCLLCGRDNQYLRDMKKPAKELSAYFQKGQPRKIAETGSDKKAKPAPHKGPVNQEDPNL